MIPKIIHFCWFGGNPKSELIQRCMASWVKYAPDFKIREWNEQTFDVSQVPFVKEAYQLKKWAFVSDYVRAHALYSEGGIYLDTDVELFGALDSFLSHEFFSGFEDYQGNLSPITAVMGGRPGHSFMQNVLDYYSTAHFLDEAGQPTLTPNTRLLSDLLVGRYGIKNNNQRQTGQAGIVLYPCEILCNQSSQSVAVHHFNGSWLPWQRRLKHRVGRWLYRFRSAWA